MLYPAIVFQEDTAGYGLIVPDVPGCVSEGDTLEETLANASEALGLALEGRRAPQPRALRDVLSDKSLADDLSRGAIVYVTLPAAGQGWHRPTVTVAPELARALDENAAITGRSRDAQVDAAVRRALDPSLTEA
ncbi:MAG: type II toxin-antitoxin system HicB family antitoxin [Pseudomonadota bacterium]